MKFQLRCEHLETRENPSGTDPLASLPPVDPITPPPGPTVPPDNGTNPKGPVDPINPPGGPW